MEVGGGIIGLLVIVALVYAVRSMVIELQNPPRRSTRLLVSFSRRCDESSAKLVKHTRVGLHQPH
jgi:hypothetical protein